MSSKSASVPTMDNVYGFMVKMKKSNFDKMNMTTKLSIRSYMQEKTKPKVPVEIETKLKKLITEAKSLGLKVKPYTTFMNRVSPPSWLSKEDQEKYLKKHTLTPNAAVTLLKKHIDARKKQLKTKYTYFDVVPYDANVEGTTKQELLLMSLSHLENKLAKNKRNVNLKVSKTKNTVRSIEVGIPSKKVADTKVPEEYKYLLSRRKPPLFTLERPGPKLNKTYLHLNNNDTLRKTKYEK